MRRKARGDAKRDLKVWTYIFRYRSQPSRVSRKKLSPENFDEKYLILLGTRSWGPFLLLISSHSVRLIREDFVKHLVKWTLAWTIRLTKLTTTSLSIINNISSARSVFVCLIHSPWWMKSMHMWISKTCYPAYQPVVFSFAASHVQQTIICSLFIHHIYQIY